MDTPEAIVIFCCRVLVGKVKNMGSQTDPLLFSEPAGYDAVGGELRHGRGVVIYTAQRVLPEFAVFCSRVEPDPVLSSVV